MDFLKIAENLRGVAGSSFAGAAKGRAVPHNASPDVIGVARDVKGEVTAISRDENGKNRERPIHSGDMIMRGEAIQTKADSFASIGLRNDKILSVGAENKIDIEAAASSLAAKENAGKLAVSTDPIRKTTAESADFSNTVRALGVRG